MTISALHADFCTKWQAEDKILKHLSTSTYNYSQMDMLISDFTVRKIKFGVIHM